MTQCVVVVVVVVVAVVVTVGPRDAAHSHFPPLLAQTWPDGQVPSHVGATAAPHVGLIPCVMRSAQS